MNPEEYRNSPSGQLIRAGSEPVAYWAFVPKPLPPKLDFDLALIRLNGEAERALGELAGLGRNLENPGLLVRPLIRREAVLSSRIEGTQAGLAELYEYEAGQHLELPGVEAAAAEADAHEVLNYVRALEYGLERVNTLPVSLRLMRELHERLMQGVRGDAAFTPAATPGEFRTRQNWIGRPGSVLNDASYVPPPVPEMKAALGDLELYLRRPDDPFPPLVRLAFIHYQFEAIHPFVDGNGRIGRLLLSLLLIEWGLLPLPLLHLSAFFEQNRDAYYDGLAAVTRRGAWRDWVAYFLNGVREQSGDAGRRLKELQDLLASWRAQLQAAKATLLMARVADNMVGQPQITAAEVVKRFGVTQPTANKTLKRLEGLGILTEQTGRKWGMTYVASEVLEILG
jgi:Fic family protein